MTWKTAFQNGNPPSTASIRTVAIYLYPLYFQVQFKVPVLPSAFCTVWVKLHNSSTFL